MTVCVALATGWGNPNHLPPQHLCLLWGLSPHDPAAILHSLRRWSELLASKYVLSMHFYHCVIPLRLSLWGTGQMTSINYNLGPNSSKVKHLDSVLFYCQVNLRAETACLSVLVVDVKAFLKCFGNGKWIWGAINVEYNWTCLLFGQWSRQNWIQDGRNRFITNSQVSAGTFGIITSFHIACKDPSTEPQYTVWFCYVSNIPTKRIDRIFSQILNWERFSDSSYKSKNYT